MSFLGSCLYWPTPPEAALGWSCRSTVVVLVACRGPWGGDSASYHHRLPNGVNLECGFLPRLPSAPDNRNGTTMHRDGQLCGTVWYVVRQPSTPNDGLAEANQGIDVQMTGGMVSLKQHSGSAWGESIQEYKVVPQGLIRRSRVAGRRGHDEAQEVQPSELECFAVLALESYCFAGQIQL